MRTIVNGILSYGLVNVPVGVCTAAKRQDFTFKTLHAKCESPISMGVRCPTCEKDNLTPDELVKGYEFTKKQYLALDNEELKKLAGERDKIIRIKKFVSWDEVDELQVESSYLLAPSELLVRPYALLSNALGEKGAVGIGSQALWGKEHPAMVWAKEGGTLVLSSLFCWDEVVSDTEIQNAIPAGELSEQELANEFVALMLSPLEPMEDLVSSSRERMNEYIKAKLSDLPMEFMVPEDPPSLTVDIQEQLRASIAAARVAA